MNRSVSLPGANIDGTGWKVKDPHGQMVCEEACEALYRDSCVIATLAQRVSDLFTRMKLELRQRDGAKLDAVMEDLQAAIVATTSMARTCHDNERVGLSLLQRLAYRGERPAGSFQSSIPAKDSSPLQPLHNHVDELHQALLTVGKSLSEEAVRQDAEISHVAPTPHPNEFDDSPAELPWDRYALSERKVRNDGVKPGSKGETISPSRAHRSALCRDGDPSQKVQIDRIRGEHDLCVWLLNAVQSDIAELRLSKVGGHDSEGNELQLQWKVQELQELLHTTKIASKKESLANKSANAELRRKLQELSHQCAVHASEKERLQRQLEKEGKKFAALVAANEEQHRDWEHGRRWLEQQRDEFEALHQTCVSAHTFQEFEDKYSSLLSMSAGLQNKYQRLVERSVSTTKELEEELAYKDQLLLQLRLEASTEVCSA